MPWFGSLLLVALPFIEIALFIEVGSLIGISATLLLVVLSTLVGFLVLRHQGFVTVTRLRASLARDENPVADVLNGALGTVSALLLIIPGFFTDGLGLLLLAPILREAIVRRLAASAMVQRHARSEGGQPGNHPRGARTDGPVIDAEDWHEIRKPAPEQRHDEEKESGSPSSPWQP